MEKITIIDMIKYKLIPGKFQKDEPERFAEVDKLYTNPYGEQDMQYQEEEQIAKEKAIENWKKFQKKHIEKEEKKGLISFPKRPSTFLKAAVLFFTPGVVLFIYEFQWGSNKTESLSFDSGRNSDTIFNLYLFSSSLILVGLICLFLAYAGKNNT